MIPKRDAKALAPTVWHKPGQTLLLGCSRCPDRQLCGGLQTEASVVLSCLDHCCGNPEQCDIVCPKNAATFPDRIHEVQGLDLMNIEKHRALAFPQVPDVVPLIYRSLPLSKTVAAPFVAIPFSEAYRRSGKRAVAHSRSALEAKFRLASDTGIILSGVENDRHVEQWWGSTERKDTLKMLREQGLVFATTPNFSMMSDVPRHDNMHSMKRIALIWSELHEAGIPTAFHVNGRTDRDFQRFQEFLKFHDEIEAIAFEYTTGAGNHERGEYFTGLLLQLADELARPLTIVLRGGGRWTGMLSHSFACVVVLDATACVRTIKRQRAVRMPGGTLRWRSNPTEKGAPLDELLSYNFTAMTESLMAHRKTTEVHTASSSEAKATRKSKRELEADHETLQGSLL